MSPLLDFRSFGEDAAGVVGDAAPGADARGVERGAVPSLLVAGGSAVGRTEEVVEEVEEQEEEEVVSTTLTSSSSVVPERLSVLLDDELLSERRKCDWMSDLGDLLAFLVMTGRAAEEREIGWAGECRVL